MLKKLLLNIFFVIVGVSILDFAIGRTLRYFYFKASSGVHYRTTYSMEKTKADILIFGSSRANHHYVPEVFEDSLNMTFYNTGRDGNGIFFQAALLNSVIKRYSPKVIIFDYLGSFEKKQDAYDRLSSLLPYYRTHEEIRKIVELKSPWEKIKLVSEIYPFNSLILMIAISNLEINKKRKPDNKGYIALYNQWQFKIDSIKNTKEYALDSNKVNAFRGFIRQAKKSGVRIYLVYSPVFQKFSYSQEIDICNKICISENIPFLNFSRDTSFINNIKLFQDIGHLNNNGAIKLSNLIVSRIRKDITSDSP